MEVSGSLERSAKVGAFSALSACLEMRPYAAPVRFHDNAGAAVGKLVRRGITDSFGFLLLQLFVQSTSLSASFCFESSAPLCPRAALRRQLCPETRAGRGVS